jgi:hypothetical protein
MDQSPINNNNYIRPNQLVQSVAGSHNANVGLSSSASASSSPSSSTTVATATTTVPSLPVGNPPSQTIEVQRKQFIQKQLVLLLHAHKCQQREKLVINGDTTRSSTCTLPHCNTMKNVLQHMTRCNDQKNCPVPHCVTSRQIILHWKQCNNVQCPICQPLKTSSNSLQSNVTASNSTLSVMNSTSNLPSTANPINKDWQRRVTQEMRNHLVQKITAALVPISDMSVMRDKRIISLTNYARRVENETFDIATNQEEYFHKLAEKIYKIQKELEDRREKKRSQDMQSTNQMSFSTGLVMSHAGYSGKSASTMDSTIGDHGPPNRTAPNTDYAVVDTVHLAQGQFNVKSEPFLTITNTSRPVSTTNSNSTSSIPIANVSLNENLDYLLNGDTMNSSQSSNTNPVQDLDTINNTGVTSQDRQQTKIEPSSPNVFYPVG